MAYQGDLENIGLATVFQNLHQSAQSGTLRVHNERRERFVHFREGHIAMLATAAGAETPVSEHLVRMGRISAEDLARAKRRADGGAFSEALRRWGGVSDQDVRAAAGQFVEEELYDLLTWTEGQFEFTEGEPAEGTFDEIMRSADLTLAPDGIILEAARRVDEWDRINRVVGSLGDIYVVPPDRAANLEALKDERVRRVGELIDGRRDVAAVIQDSGAGRFAVMRALSKLIDERIIRPAGPAELSDLAGRAEASEDIEGAVRLLRRALDLERSNTELRFKLARLLVRGGEKEEAASEYKLLANMLAEAGEVERASDALRQAVGLVPTDVGARERLVQMLSDSRKEKRAITAAIDLADMYAALGLHEKARGPLEKILSLKPRDSLPVERKLLEAYKSLGDVRSAVGTLRRIARRALKANDFEEAARYYDELLGLDSSDAEARKRLAEIRAGMVERMREYRRTLVRAAIMAAVGVPLLALVARDFAARPAEAEARLGAIRAGMDASRVRGEAMASARERKPAEAAAMLETASAGYLEAAECIRAFREEWPWTLSGGRLAAEIDQWRLLAGQTLLASADHHRIAGDFDRAHATYARLSRSTDMPAEIARQADEGRAWLEEKGLVKGRPGAMDPRPGTRR